MGFPLEILISWILVGGVVGALVGPRQGWTPGVSALIGATFGIFGWLFLLIVRAPGPSPESTRLADELEEAWQAAGNAPRAAPAPYVPCPQCETPVPVTARRCPRCHTELSTCEECGGVIPLREMVCRYCGTEYYDDEAHPERPADSQ